MIFSDKILKINSGQNTTLFAKNENVLFLYLFDKTLKMYEIQLNNNKNCVFVKEYNYDKIIQLNENIHCLCGNEFMTIKNETEL